MKASDRINANWIGRHLNSTQHVHTAHLFNTNTRILLLLLYLEITTHITLENSLLDAYTYTPFCPRWKRKINVYVYIYI